MKTKLKQEPTYLDSVRCDCRECHQPEPDLLDVFAMWGCRGLLAVGAGAVVEFFLWTWW